MDGGSASGSLSIPLSGVDDGTYTLHIFSEQDNGGNNTDFCSQPVTMKLVVNSGSGTVSDFDGDVLSGDATLLKVVGQDITGGGQAGTDDNPITASIDLDNSVDQVEDDNLEAAAGATAALYFNDTYDTPQSPVTLEVGDNLLYIKVTAEDDTALHYKVTATRAAPGQHTVTVTAQPNEGGNPTATPTNAAKDDTVTLDANPANGYTFDRWESSSNGVTFADDTDETTTFTMPDNDVTVTAHYTPDGTTPPGGTLAATPTQLDFDKVEVDGSATKTVKVTGTNLTLPIGYSVTGTDAGAFSVSEAAGWSDTDGGDLEVTFSPDDEGDYNAILTLSSDGARDVTVSLSGKGVSDNEGEPDPGPDPEPEPEPDPAPIPDGNGGGGGSSARSSSSSRSGSSNVRTEPKATLPATAFSWDGRTLTIDHDSITPLGLLSVQWDGAALTRGQDYAVYQGSVIVRFAEDFMAAQATGDHTVRVEFLNHTGEATVTVGGTGLTNHEPNDDLYDNATHNPNTGGYPDGYMDATDNPNTGDGRGIWAALLLGSLGAAALVKLRPMLEVK